MLCSELFYICNVMHFHLIYTVNPLKGYTMKTENIIQNLMNDLSLTGLIVDRAIILNHNTFILYTIDNDVIGTQYQININLVRNGITIDVVNQFVITADQHKRTIQQWRKQNQLVIVDQSPKIGSTATVKSFSFDTAIITDMYNDLIVLDQGIIRLKDFNQFFTII